MKTTIPCLILILFLTTTMASAAVPDDVSGTRPNAGNTATEISVGLYLIDMSRVNGADQSFTADLFILLRWHDPRLEGAFEATQRVSLETVWHPRLQILNQRVISTTFPEQAEITPDGTVITRQRYFGTFSAPLDLHDFPLDKQRFSVRMVVPGYGTDEVRLVPESTELAGSMRAETFSIADWDLGAIDAGPEPYRVTTAGREISGYRLAFDGRRHIGFWAGKAFISVFIIVAMSWIVFWVDPKHVGPRLSVTVTAMLTLIAYRFLLAQMLPRLSYLTLMDYFLIGSTLLVLLAVIEVAATTRAMDRDHGRRAQQINTHSRWFFPTIFASMFAAMASVG
jgi:Neurotransmitter-gated ion-channel ligand binding domain/Neurotransmitter-gated ion-channel transmembrane region